jgi:hypothetical protein
MNVENNNIVFVPSDLLKRNAVAGIIISCLGIFPMSANFLNANSIFDAVFYALISVFLLLVLIYSVSVFIRCRIIVSGMLIIVQQPFWKEEIDMSRFDSYDIIRDNDKYTLSFYNEKNTTIKRQSININLIEEKDRFLAYISEQLILREKNIRLKKRFFPGTDTLPERKKFAIFHACTFIISPLIGALLLFLFALSHRSISSLVHIGLERIIFSDVRNWLLCSLFCWNFIGGWRFYLDWYRKEGFFAGRLMILFCMFFFPLMYLHNLWCIMIKKNS